MAIVYINKSELIKKLAKRARINKKTARQILNAELKVIYHNLSAHKTTERNRTTDVALSAVLAKNANISRRQRSRARLRRAFPYSYFYHRGEGYATSTSGSIKYRIHRIFPHFIYKGGTYAIPASRNSKAKYRAIAVQIIYAELLKTDLSKEDKFSTIEYLLYSGVGDTDDPGPSIELDDE